MKNKNIRHYLRNSLESFAEPQTNKSEPPSSARKFAEPGDAEGLRAIGVGKSVSSRSARNTGVDKSVSPRSARKTSYLGNDDGWISEAWYPREEGGESWS